MSPIHETPNTVTVGQICLSCALYLTKECPYGNHNKSHVTEFTGDNRGKCIYYLPIAEANNNKMTKEARTEKEAKLNVELYKKIFALSEEKKSKLHKFLSLSPEEKEKIFKYWSGVFPPEYADEMTDDYNASEQKGTDSKQDTSKEKRKEKQKKKKENKPGIINFFKFKK